MQIDKLGEQIGRQLLWAIADGRYRPGNRFPGEWDLARVFKESHRIGFSYFWDIL